MSSRFPRLRDLRARIGPWLRRYRHRLAAAVGLGLVAGALATLPQSRAFDLRGLDFLLPLRHLAYGPLFPPSRSDVVIVAVDEQTYRTDPFSNTPKVAWTPYLGYVIDAVDAADPKAIGLDVIYPTSLDRPELLRGYDRPFLLSLRRAADQNRLVLGEARLSGETLAPYPGQVLAARGQDNLRMLDLKLADDDVVRRYWRAFANQEGGETPSFGVELARRAGARAPRDDFIINFNTGPGDVPVYSLADLYACAAEGHADYFRKAFAGKVVLFGEAVDVEDRFRSAKRLTWDEASDARAAPARCKIAADPARFAAAVNRRSMPGVMIHAAAINTLTKHMALRQAGPGATFAVVAAATAFLAGAFLFLPPVTGAAVGLAALAAELLASVAALKADIVAPAPSLLAAAVLSYTLVYAYRFVIEDREKRWIQHAFRHYLAPALVDQLQENPDALKLGGEERWVTVMFTDIAGFTTISEGLKETPDRLVDLMNRYLTVISGVIARHDGYVDKFIGDAVMAVWGAPLNVENAERKAVDAALECQVALDAFNREVVIDFLPSGRMGTRIGLATGVAIAGNMGSAERLNYTVTGDMVNLAARLEGANKEYGASIMISELTAKALGEGYVLRRLDRLIVKGKTEPIVVFEALGRRDGVSEEVLARVADFERALGLHDARDFAAALEIFRKLASVDPPSRVYAERCEAYLVTPPPADWQGEFALKTK
ncbi:MAG TPA: adenylate/guanylate cyclase domain-containing protein [Phenylobacterium sp.]|uniref:adenylate/guanylate cyclase domain-containing protein n=1 Tax=Phenylobacterium sp. TaxID=1871053 RepID=UPI002BE9A15E|nr:adenylate/guanylate cyclase domain-containing protein [Phenylobacterium sp.]HXA38158.1 adenylate/guanylate cyclase domain-containing protein [Phenylobacterium sp.]